LKDGSQAKITRIEQRYEPLLQVSNLTVRGFHTFFVGNESILVHNTSWCELRLKVVEELGPGVSELQIRIAMAHRAGKNTTWTDLISKKGDGTDALGRTKAQANAMGMPNIHGHHIKYKQAVTEQDMLIQNTLLDYGIDPMYGKEVLVIALLKGHPGAMNIAVGDAVKDVLVQAKNGNKTSAETREMIVIALQKQAEAYIESRWPGYLKSFSIFK
jgi:hypothetical protein